MNKLAYVLVLVLALFVCRDSRSSALRAEGTTAGPPNIVMIISDDQAWNDYGFMGHRHIKTPHLDGLAAESALFTRGYVPSSLCRPSLATLITGLYPHQHGITGNDPPRGTDRNLMLKNIRRSPALPRLLAKQGYVSHQSGKWWEGNYSTGGFTAGMTHGDVKRGGRHGDKGLKVGREGVEPVLDFIDNCGSKPFFVWYAPFLPHTPHNPPERILAKYQVAGRSQKLAKYFAMCEWFDETCGQILDHLDDRKLAENTLVVYVTDNGWIQRTEHTAVPEKWKFQFAPKSKRSPYDGGLRTPIMLRWPGKIAPTRCETPINSIDLAPTILKAAGISPPEEMNGIDLIPLLENPNDTKRTIFGEVFAHDLVDIDKPITSLQYRWAVAGNWKLILPHSANEAAELYYLADDPFEERNLAANRPTMVKKLTAEIDGWWPAKGQ